MTLDGLAETNTPLSPRTSSFPTTLSALESQTRYLDQMFAEVTPPSNPPARRSVERDQPSDMLHAALSLARLKIKEFDPDGRFGLETGSFFIDSRGRALRFMASNGPRVENLMIHEAEIRAASDPALFIIGRVKELLAELDVAKRVWYNGDERSTQDE